MGTPFNLCTYSLNVQNAGYSVPPAIWAERSAPTDWSIDKPMSEDRIDPYIPGFSPYILSRSDEMQGICNQREVPPGSSGDSCSIEECQAESCFFGCKGHPWSNQTRIVSSFDPTIGRTKVPGLESQDPGASDGFGHLYFKRALHSSVREGNFPSWSENASGIERFSRGHPSSFHHGLAYHSRHASVPSSPTHPSTQRERRMSEPFNSIMGRHIGGGSSVGSTRSTSPSIPFKGPVKTRDPKPILFKTELCRSWEEKGSCRYGYNHSYDLNSPEFRNKCQFAHSLEELRPVPRHPKYKTQLCKTFLEVYLQMALLHRLKANSM